MTLFKCLGMLNINWMSKRFCGGDKRSARIWLYECIQWLMIFDAKSLYLFFQLYRKWVNWREFLTSFQGFLNIYNVWWGGCYLKCLCFNFHFSFCVEMNMWRHRKCMINQCQNISQENRKILFGNTMTGFNCLHFRFHFRTPSYGWCNSSIKR